jgi:membrane protein implicated in regulation of membrane protease activity
MIEGLENWGWIIAGILLCAAEMMAPGMFLLWIGLAAIATGLTVFVIPLGFEWRLIAFCAYAIISVLIGRKVYGASQKVGDKPFLNRRAENLVGRTFPLADAISNGEGRIRVNDSVWRVRGPDLPAGQTVKVTGVEDSVTLRVERV